MEVKVRPSVRIDAAELERQRIIELLTNAKTENHPMLTWQYAMELAIALIKGENK